MIKKILAFAIAIIIASPIFAQELSLKQTLKKHCNVLASDTLEGRAEGSNGIKKARKYIIDELKKTGIKPYQGKYEYDFSFKVGAVRALSQNIIAYIEGSDSVLKKEYIVIGAHYDHIGWNDVGHKMIYYNGADDNASGTASIIEIAKLLNSNKSSLKRSIIIIGFGAEESGLIGSQHIFTDSIIAPAKIKCMFSLDMVGMYKANNGINLIGFEILNDYKSLIEKAKNKAPIKIQKMSKDIEKRTDTKSFGDEGIPAVHITTGLKSHYHRYQDDSNLLDYEGMADIDMFVYELTKILADEPALKPIKSLIKTAKDKGTFYLTPYIKAGIGSSHNHYPDEFFDAKSILSYNVGISAKLSLNQVLAFQPEVIYESSGSQSKAGIYRTNRLSIPFHIILCNDNAATENVFLMLGGYFKNSLNGVDARTVIDYSKNYNKWQYGVSFGFGFEFANIQVNAISQYGLSYLFTDPKMDKILERAGYLNIGVGL